VSGETNQKDNRSVGAVRSTYRIRRIEYHVLDHWKGRSIADITRRDVHDVPDRPKDAGNVATAIRLHSNLGRLFKWATNRGIIEAHKNPMLSFERPGADVRRDRELDNNELAQVLRRADAIG